MDVKDFGAKLKALIKSLNMTQNDFANRLGIDSTALTRYIRGERIPRIDILYKIEQKFKVPISYFGDDLSFENNLLDIKQLVYRNGKNLSDEDKKELISVLKKSIGKDDFKNVKPVKF